MLLDASKEWRAAAEKIIQAAKEIETLHEEIDRLRELLSEFVKAHMYKTGMSLELDELEILAHKSISALNGTKHEIG